MCCAFQPAVYGERMETGLKRNRLFQLFPLDTWAFRVGEGRVMAKPHGPEDFSSSNCQVPVCCRELCSVSHPIYIYFFLFLSFSVAGGCS